MKSTILRKALALMLALAGSVSATIGAADKVIKLNFDETMFKIDETNGFINSIQYTKGNTSMPGDTSAPALPLVYFKVGAPAGVDCSFSPRILSQKLLMSNVDIARVPEIIYTSQVGKLKAETNSMRYTGGIYPAEICTNNGKSQWSDATIFQFSCSPFVYDGKHRNLYLIQELAVDINFLQVSAEKLNFIQTEMTRRPEFIKFPIDSLISSKDSSIHVVGPPLIHEDEFTIDYLIITSDAYKSDFEPLINWKRTKGLTANIVTVESIQTRYSGKDIQAKIKNYIRQAVKNFNTKFVLLGGDESVIPPRYCAGDKSDTLYKFNAVIPCDYYYCCLNDPYDWDKNGNGIYGEPEDEIKGGDNGEYYDEPCVAVTRLPLSSSESIETYINRLIQYEMNPAWNNSILLSGTAPERDSSGNIVVSAYNEGLSLYYTIKWHWNGSIDFLFDEKNTFGINGTPVFTSANLSSKIAEGYNFIDINAHGLQDCFGMELNTDLYSLDDAATQINPCHSIVTTSACLTNAFDMMDGLIHPTCMSEAFLMNQQNMNTGIVAYYGSSRSGYYPLDPNVPSPSMAFDGKFYLMAFSDDEYPVNKHFGAVVAASKYEVLDCYNAMEYTWLRYSLNPMGDPEMLIFRNTPKEFDNVIVSHPYTSDNKLSINIHVDEPGCIICVTGANGYRRVFKNQYDVIADGLTPNSAITVCITKPDFKPCVQYMWVSNVLTQAIPIEKSEQFLSLDMDAVELASGSIINIDKGTNNVNVYTEVNAIKSAHIIISNISGSYVRTYNVDSGLSNTYISVPALPKGIYTITLFVDGVSQDVKRLII